MLTLTPLVCSMAAISVSHLLDTFLDPSSKDGEIFCHFTCMYVNNVSTWL